MCAQVPSNRPRIKVIATARPEADHDADRAAGVEVGNRIRVHRQGKCAAAYDRRHASDKTLSQWQLTFKKCKNSRQNNLPSEYGHGTERSHIRRHFFSLQWRSFI